MRFARIIAAGVLSTGLVASGVSVSSAVPTESAGVTAERSAVAAFDTTSEERAAAKDTRPFKPAYKPRKKQFIVNWPTYAGQNAKLQLSKRSQKAGFKTVAVKRTGREGRVVFGLKNSYYPPTVGKTWYLRVQARETTRYRLTNVCCVETFKRIR